MHEFELIDRIRLAFDGGRGPGVDVGIGDDAAVLDFGAARTVVTTDAQIERVHFDRRWGTLAQVGARAVEVNISDLAAMGATPRVLLLSLAAPAVDADALLEVVNGFGERARARGCAVVGGNVSRASELSLTVTAIGTLAMGGAPVLRSGAGPDDLVFVTGPMGGAALGLALLEAGLGADPAAAVAVARLCAPIARVDVGLALAGLATAALDVSDGLTQDLGHLALASGVAIDVQLEHVPTVPLHAELAARAGADPVALITGGGEDYELAFTAPPGARPRALALGATEIGVVRAGSGVRIVDRDGTPVTLAHTGFQHF